MVNGTLVSEKAVLFLCLGNGFLGCPLKLWPVIVLFFVLVVVRPEPFWGILSGVADSATMWRNYLCR
jgi:hypothetical protein